MVFIGGFPKAFAEDRFEYRLKLREIAMNQVVELRTPARRRQEARLLMRKAWGEVSLTERVGLAQQALACDPSCIDALAILIAQAQLPAHLDPIESLTHAVAEEERALRNSGLADEYAGSFWTHQRTRVFLRALSVLVRLYLKAERWPLARQTCEQIISLDRRDTKGHRYTLATLLIREGDYSAFHALDKHFKQENSVIFLFNRALVGYVESGRGSASYALAKRALVFNPLVVRYLEHGTDAAMPQQAAMSPELLAWLYAKENRVLWERTPGAMRWLSNVLAEMRNR